jgi:hypothetical protein
LLIAGRTPMLTCDCRVCDYWNVPAGGKPRGNLVGFWAAGADRTPTTRLRMEAGGPHASCGSSWVSPSRRSGASRLLLWNVSSHAGGGLARHERLISCRRWWWLRPQFRDEPQNLPASWLALLWQILRCLGFPNQFFCDSWAVGLWRGRPWQTGDRTGRRSLDVFSSRFWLGWVTRGDDRCVLYT